MPPVWLRYTQKTVTATISADLDAKVKSARQALDAWVREIVSWHFDPATGCPFWLDFAKGLDWDPRREIRSYDDLDRFPFFQDEWLRGGPMRRWVPRAYADKPVRSEEHTSELQSLRHLVCRLLLEK